MSTFATIKGTTRTVSAFLLSPQHQGHETLTTHQRPHRPNQRNQPLFDPLLCGGLIALKRVRVLRDLAEAGVGGLLGLGVGEC